MDTVLKKDEALDLPRQISNILRQRIESGEYLPGKRLGGIRQFAASFSVSPVTFIRALDILEAEKLIDRVPSKGIFVAERLRNRKRRLKACFAFPEKSMDLQTANSENYSTNSEFYRGMMTGAKNAGADLQFSYFEDHVHSAKLKHQLALIRQFDFVIFPSVQLGKLQKLASEKCIVFQRAMRMPDLPDRIITLDYNRQDARDRLFSMYLNSGCKSAAVIASAERERVTEFLEHVRSVGGKVPNGGAFYLGKHDTSSAKAQIREILTKLRPEFIFCDYTDMVNTVYEVTLEEHLTIGKDFQMTGISSGVPLMNLLPRYTFLQIPHFEFGKEVMERSAEAIRNGTAVALPEFKVSLIEGQSIKNIKERNSE